ncbi:Ubiquitin carboxyl-terminal hydrolase 1 [Frankliniella fusca]|uniref:Ubiquitin carboxyl-terminal hydrolase 1 n=1 Tax=Frankliniella fusca TaxID=407009 RepID=A0AAE1LUU8_9NEOP|nr:Ubiquitin carboxyl-terminal hydrolase 1 [Frankliniella fusca]
MKVLSAYLEMGFVDAKKKNHRMFSCLVMRFEFGRRCDLYVLKRLRCHGKRYGDKQHSGYGLLPVSCLRISPGHNASTKVTDQKSLELCIPFKFRKVLCNKI